MLKLVFVDMDGTFLNSAKKITSENLAAMDLAAQKGVQFVPCTGRNVNGIPEQMVSHPSVNSAVTAPSSVTSAPAAFCTRLA